MALVFFINRNCRLPAIKEYNELPLSSRRSVFSCASDIISEPIFLLLVACRILYLLIGDVQEALMFHFFIFVVLGITLYQERKNEHALDVLGDLTSPRASVVRDGVEKRISRCEVVKGDILIVNESERISADAVLFSCQNLLVQTVRR